MALCVLMFAHVIRLGALSLSADSLDDAAAERLSNLTDNLDDPPTSFFDLSDQDVADVKRLEMIQET